ncbi:MAG: transposase [Bacteroidota bacterium]
MSRNYDPKKHHRRSIRLKNYDYSRAGFYFVTVCIKDHVCLLGQIKHGEMTLNSAGKMINQTWLDLPKRFPTIKLHEHIVMPNHFHGIIEILDTWKNVKGKDVIAKDGQILPFENEQLHGKGQPQGIAPTKKKLGDIVGAFESLTTVEYIKGVKNEGWERFDGKLWQRNYWEHIIRHQQSFSRIANYIQNNVITWEKDKFYQHES